MMKYKGYTAKVEFDPEAEILHGEIAEIADVVTFQADSIPQLRVEFELAVDDYLAFCKEQNREAQRPYSGRFVVRLEPELHRAVAIAASHGHLSLNSYVTNALRAAMAGGTRSARPAEHGAEVYAALVTALTERSGADPKRRTTYSQPVSNSPEWIQPPHLANWVGVSSSETSHEN
jgi:predicted HicB family RNase H-like nuclease